MDGIVTRLADHKGLPPFGCHDRRPCWLVGSGLTEPREFGDVVNHHRADVLTQLAPAPHEPVDDLFAGIGNPNRSTINDNRALVPCERYPAEPCYQMLGVLRRLRPIRTFGRRRTYPIPLLWLRTAAGNIRGWFPRSLRAIHAVA